jgi:hypothetical protein
VSDTTRVEITHVCFIRKPDDVIRCTRPPGHEGDHHDYLAGVTDSKGRRPGVWWPRRGGETQFD